MLYNMKEKFKKYIVPIIPSLIIMAIVICNFIIIKDMATRIMLSLFFLFLFFFFLRKIFSIQEKRELSELFYKIGITMFWVWFNVLLFFGCYAAIAKRDYLTVIFSLSVLIVGEPYFLYKTFGKKQI